MASIIRESGGRKTIQFVGPGGKRPKIHLGVATMDFARSFKRRVELLLCAKLANQPVDRETAEWLGGVDHRYYKRLVAVALVPDRQRKMASDSLTLGALVKEYISLRHDVKPRTMLIFRQAQKSLFEYFEENKLVKELTAGEGDCWRLKMLESLAEGTVRKRCGIIKQILRWAMRRKLIDENPFTDIPSAAVADISRDHYVPVAEIQKIMQYCPLEWKLIVALSRYAGLRVPSELRSLTWADVLWDENIVIIHSPKTARYQGKESRRVPIAPELRVLLDTAFYAAPEGTTHVISHRDSDQNMRTQLNRYAIKAGVKLWGKPFMNMRQSLANDWAERFPAHAVHQWLGHSRAVAEKHYLRVNRETEARAARENLGAKEAVQKAVQLAPELLRMDSQKTGLEPSTTVPENLPNSSLCNDLQTGAEICRKSLLHKEIHHTGLEPVTFGSVDRCSIQLS